MPKKSVDYRQRLARQFMGLPLRGRPGGRRTGTKPGKRSIPKAWRDLDNGCLEFALNELNDESWGDEQFVRFVNCAARRARFHERQGDYKVRKLSGKPTEPRKSRTHEQRVRQLAKAALENMRRELFELKP